MKIKLLVAHFVLMNCSSLFGTVYTQSTLSKVYATPYAGQIQQYNNYWTQGALYTPFGTAGSQSLDAQLSGGTAQAIQALPDGAVIVALSKATENSQIAQYNAQGFLVSSYGSSGIVDLGFSTLAAQTMMLDTQGRILVAGGDYTVPGIAGWLERVTANGQEVFNFSGASGYWQFIAGLGQQTTGKIIAAGSNNVNAQIARYNLDGSLDTTFANAGYVIFDGTNGLSSTTGLYGVVVDASDNIYVAYLDGISLKVAKFNPLGTLDASFGASNGIAAIPLLDSAIASQVRMAIDVAGDLVIGASLGNFINVVSITASAGSPGSFANFSTGTFNQLQGLVATSDGKIILLGSQNRISPYTMAVMRLTSAGDLDDATTDNNVPFNTSGYNLFNIATPTVASVLLGASLTPNGQFNAVGYQSTGDTPTITPYLSCLYDAPYVTQVAQYPAADLQGNFDTTFGINRAQSFAGVLMPYKGNFGQLLQQKARAIIELTTGDFLVGTDGLTNSTTDQTMMLTWLTSSGTLDTSFGSGTGQLTLPNVSTSNEEMVALAVGGSGNIFIAGTNGTPAPYIHSYSASGSAISALNDTGIASVGIAIQGSAGVLLFVQDDGITGHISRYTATSGILSLDTVNFGTSGQIATDDFGLYMGPIYGGGLVNRAENIIIAFKYSDTGTIDLAMINKNGTALIEDFGSSGTVTNIFSSTSIAASNVRTAFDEKENIYVAAVSANGGSYIIGRFDAQTGVPDTEFNAGNILTITPGSIITAPLFLTNLTGISDGSVMLTGYDSSTNPVMVTLRVTKDGSLDTTFGSQQSVPGIVTFQIEDETADYTARVATSVAIQSHGGTHGNVLLTAYEQQSSTESTPEVMRLYGQSGTTQVQRYPAQDQYAGTLDVALNGCGALDITDLTAAGTAKVVYAYQLDNAHAGKLLIGVDTGTDIYLTRVDAVSLEYDPSFNGFSHTPGLYVVSGYTGLNNIMVDRDNQIILCGTTSRPAGWAVRVPEEGNITFTVFNMPADITAVNKVYQQQSGRYIFAGSTNTGNVGTLIAFQDALVSPATQLAVDYTFNPLARLSAAGRWNIENSTDLYNLAINFDDTIYVAYKDTTTGFLTIAQVLADGSGFDLAFNSSDNLVTSIIPDNASVVRLVVDASQNIIVAASCGSGTSLQAFRCNLTGGASTAFVGSGVTSGVLTISQPVGGTDGITLQTVLETQAQQTILIGSNATGGHGQMFAARLSSTGPVDTTWNPFAVSPDVPGMLTFGESGNPLTDPITIMSNAAIDIVGNIFVVGGTGTNPILMEIVGDNYVDGVEQGQQSGLAGTLDLTIAETSGSLNLRTASLVTTAYLPRKLSIYADGSMLLATSNNSSTTQITKLSATLELDHDFNDGIIVSLGSGTATCNDMFVDDAVGKDGQIYLTGVNSGALWSSKVSADGSTIIRLATLVDWTAGYAIGTASNDDIMVAGFNGTNGALAAFLPSGAQLDPLFATSGIYVTSSTNPIAAMAIDQLSRIYIAYATSDTNINLDRLTAAGVLDTTFGTDGTIAITGTVLSTTQIALALDVANNQIVIACVDLEQDIKVLRFNTQTSVATGGVEFAISDKNIYLADLLIDTDQEIYVIAGNITDHKVVVARLVSQDSDRAISFDATYAAATDTPGIANITAGSMTNVGAGILDPDGRIYVVGNSGATSYMARLFGDNYYTQLSQAMPGFAPGQFDLSYGVGGIAQTDAGVATLQGQQARAIVPLSAGTKIMTVVANADGSNAWTAQLLSNGANDGTYTNGGTGNGVLIARASGGAEYVSGMVFDGSGNTIVFGGNTELGGYIKSLLPTGLINPAFGVSDGTTSNGMIYLSQFDNINAVAQMSNGNFVCVGYKIVNNTTVGIVAFLNSQGTLLSSPAIKNLGINVASVSIDISDNIYVSYVTINGNYFNANVAKLTSNGSFARGYSASQILTDLNDPANIRSVIDANGRVIVAVTCNSSFGNMKVTRLESSGAIDSTFGVNGIFSLNFAADTVAIVTSLIALQSNQILIAGYQYDFVDADNNDYEFVVSITSDGALNTDFNATSDMPGILTFQVASGEQEMRNVWNMNIQSDGQILLAGSEESLAYVNSPLTMRIDGYPAIKSVPQFPGLISVVPSNVYADFGIAFTTVIDSLVDGGSTAVDSQGRVLIGGRTEDSNTLVVARFLQDGTLDENFGIGGITQTPGLATLTNGFYIIVDTLDNIFIGGVTSDNTFIIAKFFHTNGSLDTTFNLAGIGTGIAGIAQSVTVTNLTSGGYLAIDYLGRPVIGGSTLDFKLAVARFTTNGLHDGEFGTSGVAQTGIISGLRHGGSVATVPLASLRDASVYIGASTEANTLLVAKFDTNGVLDGSYGTDGIAQTGQLRNLADGGQIAIDTNRKVIVGGFTLDKMFIAARFTSAGTFDPTFSSDGIALSNPLTSLDSCLGVTTDHNNNVLLGGTSTAYDNISKSMVVARFTPFGAIDTTFTSTGIATTGVINGLVRGGFVATNALSNPFVAGFDGTKLVVAALYSGAEIFIANPSSLPALPFELFWYGNNVKLWRPYLGIDIYALLITDSTVRDFVTTQLSSSLDEYQDAVFGKLGLYLASSVYPVWSGNVGLVRDIATQLYPDSSGEILACFDLFTARTIVLHNALSQYSTQQ